MSLVSSTFFVCSLNTGSFCMMSVPGSMVDNLPGSQTNGAAWCWMQGLQNYDPLLCTKPEPWVFCYSNRSALRYLTMPVAQDLLQSIPLTAVWLEPTTWSCCPLPILECLSQLTVSFILSFTPSSWIFPFARKLVTDIWTLLRVTFKALCSSFSHSAIMAPVLPPYVSWYLPLCWYPAARLFLGRWELLSIHFR